MTDDSRLLSGRYRVGKLIGRGGMGRVYLGTDTRLGRTVAIKILKYEYSENSTFRQRFRAEAQAAARMNHPNIVRTYDTGEDEFADEDGTRGLAPFIVMEYVEGRTVRELIRSGELSIRDSVRIIKDVLTALEYSHRVGIVHRDIKPGNIMVSISGHVKVMDFGVAKAVADSSSTQALSGGVVGTATYFAPEQAKGETVDQRADLYSTAVTLFEMLTGEPPFSGDSPASVAYQHVNTPPPSPRDLNPEIPAPLASVVDTALAKDPAARYQSARAFISDLEAVASGRVPVLTTGLVAVTDDPEELLAGLSSRSPGEALGELTNAETFTAPTPVTPASKKSGVAGIWIAVGTFVLLATAALVWFLTLKPIIDLESRQVTIPDLTNMTSSQAQSTLQGLELVVQLRDQTSDTIAADQVISSDPSTGAVVIKGSSVTLYVSTGKEQQAVPVLTSLLSTVAQERLVEAGFTLGEITVVDSATVSKDLVISSDPPAGTMVDVGSVINIVKSSGFSTVTSYVGKDLDSSVEAVQKLGFSATGTPSYRCDGDENTIVTQTPEAGRVAANSLITFTYINKSRCWTGGDSSGDSSGDNNNGG